MRMYVRIGYANPRCKRRANWDSEDADTQTGKKDRAIQRQRSHVRVERHRAVTCIRGKARSGRDRARRKGRKEASTSRRIKPVTLSYLHRGPTLCPPNMTAMDQAEARLETGRGEQGPRHSNHTGALCYQAILSVPEAGLVLPTHSEVGASTLPQALNFLYNRC